MPSPPRTVASAALEGDYVLTLGVLEAGNRSGAGELPGGRDRAHGWAVAAREGVGPRQQRAPRPDGSAHQLSPRLTLLKCLRGSWERSLSDWCVHYMYGRGLGS